jgi:nucleotide-binding universal stress UspA family protein
MPIGFPDGGAFVPLPVVPPTTRRDVMQQLRMQVAASGIDGPDLATLIGEGDPPTAIVAQAATMGADLVVMGTHGRSGFDRFVLGSVTEKVLREAPCPVLTVPPRAPSPSPARPLKRILCAVDFSPASVDSFRYAVDIGRHAGASVLAVHAIDWLEEGPRDDAEDSGQESFREYLLNDGRRRLADVVSHETAGGDGVVTTVVAGRADREILRLADGNGTDLIVMGVQGRGGAALALFGSTTQQVVRKACCVVLTVR